jgi:ankyrin repeat protein
MSASYRLAAAAAILLVGVGCAGMARDAALEAGSRTGDLAVVRVCLALGANVNQPFGSVRATPLMRAADGARVDVMRLLLDKGARVNESDLWGHTALTYALGRGEAHEGAVRLLLAAGADPNPVNTSTGQTPLHLVARTGNSEVARLLVAAGADPRLRDGADRTPLEVARVHKRWRLVPVLGGSSQRARTSPAVGSAGSPVPPPGRVHAGSPSPPQQEQRR